MVRRPRLRGREQGVRLGLSWGRSFQTQEAGAVTVEFAIIFLLFILLIAGIVEFGHLWYLKHHITRASREGARWAVVYRVDNSTPPKRVIPTAEQIRQFLANGDSNHYPILGQGFIDYYDVRVVAPAPSGDDFTVTVTANQNLTFLLTGLINVFGNDFQGINQITATTTMKLE